jgi:hypothetical protein
MKISKNHTVYEIWNEYCAESVFVDFGRKPTKSEIREICKEQQWFDFGYPQFLDVHIEKYILVEKLKRFYVL